MIDDELMEQLIQEKGLTAPRITPDTIEAKLKAVWYYTHVVPNTTTTICVAVLNGFTLAIEYSGCVDKANFDEEIGATIARGKAKVTARDKLWELEGYALHKELKA